MFRRKQLSVDFCQTTIFANLPLPLLFDIFYIHKSNQTSYMFDLEKKLLRHPNLSDINKSCDIFKTRF